MVQSSPPAQQPLLGAQNVLCGTFVTPLAGIVTAAPVKRAVRMVLLAHIERGRGKLSEISCWYCCSRENVKSHSVQLVLSRVCNERAAGCYQSWQKCKKEVMAVLVQQMTPNPEGNSSCSVSVLLSSMGRVAPLCQGWIGLGCPCIKLQQGK